MKLVPVGLPVISAATAGSRTSDAGLKAKKGTHFFWVAGLPAKEELTAESCATADRTCHWISLEFVNLT
jgi:hypothetical protein